MSQIGFRIAILVSAVTLSYAAPAKAQDGVVLDYGQALQRLAARSGAVQGADLDYRAKQLQSEALRRIDSPDLRLTGFAGRISTSLNVDTSRITQVLEPGLASVLELLPPALSVSLPEIPDAIEANRVFNVRSLGMGSIWPLYTGGRLQALKAVAAGRADEAGAGLQSAVDEAALQLAQRYFGLQLARKARRLRATAVTAAQEHQQMARRLERIGLIAKIERLKADVAVDNAVREAAKAASDLEIAELALRRMLAEERQVVPATPLFVHERAVGSLASFVEASLASNAAWKQIEAKRAQADANLKLQGKAFSPTVIGIANYNLNRSGAARANWLIGLALSVPLFDRVDRAKLGAAARLEQQRVEVAAEQAGRDIPTLAESQWRAMEDARQRYLALASAIELAQETLRLAQVSFKNGQATTADVNDASLNLTKTGIERAQAAYDYVLALARLLGTAGSPERLGELARSGTYAVELEKE